MKKYIVKLNGKEYEVEIEEVTRQENEQAPKAASPSQAAAPAPKAAPARPASATGVQVKSPMPGSIVELKVKPGDAIKEGQVLLVLEAMKMLNEIVAPQAGTVMAVGVQKGDMVGSGDLLVTIG